MHVFYTYLSFILSNFVIIFNIAIFMFFCLFLYLFVVNSFAINILFHCQLKLI